MLSVLVHVYSLNVSSQAIFKKVQKILIAPREKDKSGAPSNEVVSEVAEQLKEIHKYNLHGADIHWQIWATVILAAEPHRRDVMMHESPPLKVADLFTRARDHSDNVLDKIHQNVAIGRSINDASSDQVKKLREEYDTVKKAFSCLKICIDNMGHRLEILENNLQSNSSLLSGVEVAADVHENDTSLIAYERVEYVEDVDHE